MPKTIALPKDRDQMGLAAIALPNRHDYAMAYLLHEQDNTQSHVHPMTTGLIKKGTVHADSICAKIWLLAKHGISKKALYTLN